MDNLKITFQQAEAFVNEVGTSIEDGTTLLYILPPQMDKNAKSTRGSNALSQSLGNTGSTLAVSGMAATMVLGFGGAELWGMINGIQLVIFTPALRLKMPANSNMFIGQIITMATFDYIPMDTVFEKYFNLGNY